MNFSLKTLLILVAAISCLCGVLAIAKEAEKPPVVFERCFYGCTLEVGRGVVVCDPKRDGGTIEVFVVKLKSNNEYDYPCIDGGLRYYESTNQIDDGFQKFKVIGRSTIKYKEPSQ